MKEKRDLELRTIQTHIFDGLCVNLVGWDLIFYLSGTSPVSHETNLV